jgi:hypothetical protein
MENSNLKKRFIYSAVILANAVLTNTALAQDECDSVHGIEKGRWHQVSVPCDPGSSKTLDQVFGDDISGKLGTDWAVYKYSQNEYHPVALNDPIKVGEGYWIIYMKGEPVVELDLPETAIEVSSNSFTVPLPSMEHQNSWYMLGLPSTRGYAVDQFTAVTDSSSCSGSGCSLRKASSNSIVHNKIWIYDGKNGGYKTIEGVDKLSPWTGGWVATLDQAYSAGNPRLVFPANSHPLGDYADLEDKQNWSSQPAGIANGYGAWGEFEVIHESEATDDNKGFIDVYHPRSSTPRKSKTVFFLSGYGQKTDSYEKLFKFIASHGYTLVNISYVIEIEDPSDWKMDEKYFGLYGLVKKAHYDYRHLIDSRYIGLMGHSLGGGAAIWLGKKLFGEESWGEQGRFIFSSAPWYTFNTTADDLKSFPNNTKLLIQIGDNEADLFGKKKWGMDERALRAIYELINIDEADKDYIRVISSEGYDADHFISQTKSTPDLMGNYGGGYDKFDAFIMNRLTHAMLDYVFEKNEDAREIALGNGSDKQVSMDGLPDLEVTDKPIVTRTDYAYTCGSVAEPWSVYWKLSDDRYCNDSDGDGIIDMLD